MIREKFEVGQNVEIDVHIQAGRVEVRPGSTGSVTVEVDTRDPGFEVEQWGDLIHISSDKNSSWLSGNSASVVVEVPKGADATIGTASAKIECHVPLGRLEAKTASGSIEVKEAETAVIKTASGDASLDNVTGDLKVSSASGDAHLSEYAGKATFSSASGDIHVGHGAGPVKASTASGDIAINRFTGEKATIKSMSGSAQIGVPAGTRLELDATLLSGSLNLPEAAEELPAGERKMSIRAKIVSGDLTIKRV